MYFNRASLTELFIYFRHNVQYRCLLGPIVFIIAIQGLIQFLRFLLIKRLFNAGTFAFFIKIVVFNMIFIMIWVILRSD